MNKCICGHEKEDHFGWANFKKCATGCDCRAFRPAPKPEDRGEINDVVKTPAPAPRVRTDGTSAPQKENKWEAQIWRWATDNLPRTHADKFIDLFDLIHSLIREAKEEERSWNAKHYGYSKYALAEARAAVLKEAIEAVEALQRFGTQQVSFAAYEKAKEDFKALLKEKSQQ